jgi:hypothetical protein
LARLAGLAECWTESFFDAQTYHLRGLGAPFRNCTLPKIEAPEKYEVLDETLANFHFCFLGDVKENFFRNCTLPKI